MMPRSKFMFAIFKENGDKILFLAKNKKSWTEDKYAARWYAYFRYAYDLKKSKFKEDESVKIMQCNRVKEVCPGGGQLYKQQRVFIKRF